MQARTERPRSCLLPWMKWVCVRNTSQLFISHMDWWPLKASVFTKSLCQVPTLWPPSRYALLTVAPSKPLHVEQQCHWKENFQCSAKIDVPNSLSTILKRNGYYTAHSVRWSHSGRWPGYDYEAPRILLKKELPFSWMSYVLTRKWGTGWNAFLPMRTEENRQQLQNNQAKTIWQARATVPPNDEEIPWWPDHKLAISKLRELKTRNTFSLMGVGPFLNHHLPV